MKIENKNYKCFRDLVYQCIKFGSGSDGKIPKTKLAKLVYLSDFLHYYRFLDPISGLEYRRLPQGPVAIQFFDILKEDKNILVENKGRAQLISLKKALNKSTLTKKAKGIVEIVCQKWKNFKTQEIVNFTHNQIPWKVSDEGEKIPYTLINLEEPNNVY